jgi:hypothetical protein
MVEPSRTWRAYSASQSLGSRLGHALARKARTPGYLRNRVPHLLGHRGASRGRRPLQSVRSRLTTAREDAFARFARVTSEDRSAVSRGRFVTLRNLLAQCDSSPRGGNENGPSREARAATTPSNVMVGRLRGAGNLRGFPCIERAHPRTRRAPTRGARSVDDRFELLPVLCVAPTATASIPLARTSRRKKRDAWNARSVGVGTTVPRSPGPAWR